MMLASRRIAVAVQSGNGLSAALAAEKRLFPSFAIKMVATGEATGELDVMLDRIADYIEYKAELRNSLLTSLTYPALVVVITVAVVVFLVTNVIPKFMSILAARNITLPDTTQLLVDITDFANRYGATILMVVLVVAFVVVITYLTRPGRLLIDRVLLSLPIVGHVLTLAFIAHFGRTLAILIKSGLPVLEGLSLLGESTANRAFARHLKCAEQRLLDGKSLSQGLQAKIVPQILPALVSIGEASGNLDTVLDELGVFHERKLRSELKWVASLFEPVMILIVGGIVGFVYISFFQVLYQMSAR
jgi:type IV pilus assembly protein PilC